MRKYIIDALRCLESGSPDHDYLKSTADLPLAVNAVFLVVLVAEADGLPPEPLPKPLPRELAEVGEVIEVVVVSGW